MQNLIAQNLHFYIALDTLTLLEYTMRFRRKCAFVPFSSRGSFSTHLFIPGQFEPEDVLAATESFLGGGTNYETPLRESMRLVEEAGMERAEIVFITDGECMLSNEFLASLGAFKSQNGLRITGLLLDNQKSFEFSLQPFCDKIFRTSEIMQDTIAEQLLLA